jgi:hypothetical protein
VAGCGRRLSLEKRRRVALEKMLRFMLYWLLTMGTTRCR